MLKPEGQIIRDLGYRDCSGTEYEVYDVSSFGKVVKLEEVAGDTPNHQILVNPETGETVIEGYSPEHYGDEYEDFIREVSPDNPDEAVEILKSQMDRVAKMFGYAQAWFG